MASDDDDGSDEELEKILKRAKVNAEGPRKKVRLIKGTRKESYVPPAVCRLPPSPVEPRRLMTRAFALVTDNYNVMVFEREDGLVRVSLKPKKTGLTHSVTHVGDGFGQSMLYQSFPCGEDLSVSWRAHEPFERPSVGEFTDESKGSGKKEG